jgi:SAM-dependent methyltransferase
MIDEPAGSRRDTAALAQRYSETSTWQHERGMLLIAAAGLAAGQQVLDLGCGPGTLTIALARRVAPTGRVLGVDPDPARLVLARKSIPADVTNLVFDQATAGDLHPVDDASVDLVFSNYVLHWVLDPAPAFGEVYRVLRPGSRFVTEFLGAPVQLFVDLIRMMPGGDAMVAENIFLDEAQWRGIIETSGLDIVDFDWPVFPIDYEDLDSLFSWLEGTSHGAFDRAKLTEEARATLAQQYPGAVSLPCTGLRMTLRRPE